MPIVCDIINVYANTKNTFFTERINFMILLDELRLELVGCRKEMEELADVLSIKASKERIEELNAETAKDGFWDDLENSQKVLQETKSLERKIEKFNKLNGQLEDVITLIELSIEEEDESSIEEIKAEAEDFKKKLEEEKLSTLLTGEYDNSNAILTFHAGAGGTEAQDWTEMLYRMYNMWAERHDYKVTLMDYLDGDDAGVKSASILIEGENAYGYMKSESGVHRLVRISPFDSSGRRHTSFAALEVMPEIDDSIEVDIRPEDIEMEVYRSSGAGGQKVNKTSSAVRLIHKPTGIVVSCQTQRSQYQNKDYAMKMLVSKLVEIKEREHLEKIEDIKGVQKEIAWGAQIRSYVFMPYTLAKDHRTGHENGNISAVMDGDLDGFINAYLTALSHGTLQK
jgi:peptide chain release factor 2